MEFTTETVVYNIVKLNPQEKEELYNAIKEANGKPFTFKGIEIEIFFFGKNGDDDCLLIKGEKRVRALRTSLS